MGFQFRVMDSQMNPLPDAELRVDGILAGYDSSSGLHLVQVVERPTLDLSVRAKGYCMLDVKSIPLQQRPFDIFMRKEDEPWYYDVNRVPVGFSLRAKDIMVVLKDVQENGNRVVEEEAVDHLLRLKDLEEFAQVLVDWQSGTGPNAFGRTTANHILLRWQRSLPSRGSEALKTLREDGLVLAAGPLVIHGKNYAGAQALGNRIYVEPAPGKDIYEAAEKIARKWGCKYDAQQHCMEFGNDAGSVVIEAQKDMVASALFAAVEIDFYRQIVADK